MVQSLNTNFVTLYFEDVLAYPNMLASHIFCLNEKIIKNINLNSKNLQCFITKVPCIIML